MSGLPRNEPTVSPDAPAQPDSLPQLLASADRQKKQSAAVQHTIDHAKEHSRRQSWIAIAVVSLYIGIVIAAVLAYFLAAWAGSNGQTLSAAASQIKDMANSLVLPIVTLVLGYYFGNRAE